MIMSKAQVDFLSLEIAGIQAQLDSLKSTLSRSRRVVRRKTVAPFAKSFGIWKGKVSLSLEDMKAEEYRLPDNLLS